MTICKTYCIQILREFLYFQNWNWEKAEFSDLDSEDSEGEETGKDITGTDIESQNHEAEAQQATSSLRKKTLMCAHCSDSLYVKWSVHLYVEYKIVCRKTEKKGSGLSCVQLMHLAYWTYVQSEQGGRRKKNTSKQQTNTWISGKYSIIFFSSMFVKAIWEPVHGSFALRFFPIA
jgi:hypothetical protein